MRLNAGRLPSLLFSVSLIFATANASAQEQVLFDYGKQWNAWSSDRRLIFVEGFVEGQSATFFALFNDLPPGRREQLRLERFTFYKSDVLSSVMTSLYADPGNTYIRYGSMVYIARDRLNGKDIEPVLRRARELDRGYVDPKN
jgi:hypothetical protein